MAVIFHSGSDSRAADDRHRFQVAKFAYRPRPDGKVPYRIECVDPGYNEPVEW